MRHRLELMEADRMQKETGAQELEVERLKLEMELRENEQRMQNEIAELRREGAKQGGVHDLVAQQMAKQKDIAHGHTQVKGRAWGRPANDVSIPSDASQSPNTQQLARNTSRCVRPTHDERRGDVSGRGFAIALPLHVGCPVTVCALGPRAHTPASPAAGPLNAHRT